MLAFGTRGVRLADYGIICFHRTHVAPFCQHSFQTLEVAGDKAFLRMHPPPLQKGELFWSPRAPPFMLLRIALLCKRRAL